jgi:hypothetical protein
MTFSLAPLLTVSTDYDPPVPMENVVNLLAIITLILELLKLLKDVLDVMNGMNFDDTQLPIPQCALPGLGYDLSRLSNGTLSPSAISGLGVLSNLRPGDLIATNAISSISGVPSNTLISLTQGDITFTANPSSNVGLPIGGGANCGLSYADNSGLLKTLEALGEMADLATLMQEINTAAQASNALDITPALVAQVLTTTSTSFKGQNAEIVYNRISSLQGSYGMPLGELVSRLGNAGDIRLGNIPISIFQAVGISDAANLAKNVMNQVSSQSDGLQKRASMAQSLDPDKLQSLSAGIYSIAHIQARQARLRIWLSQILSLFGGQFGTGTNLSIDLGSSNSPFNSGCA